MRPLSTSELLGIWELGLAEHPFERPHALLVVECPAFEDLRKAGGKQLPQALPKFSAGLVTLVQSFNSALTSLSIGAPQVMRLFAPLVFEKTIEAMFGGNATLPHDALLDVAVLKGTTMVDPSQMPSPDQIVMQQRVTSFS